MIALAHSLNLQVVAEGVETLEQLSFLREKNCDEIQGFIVSRPTSTENFAKLVQSRIDLHAESTDSIVIPHTTAL